jgi:hypothetical protein
LLSVVIKNNTEARIVDNGYSYVTELLQFDDIALFRCSFTKK